jgi:hypothetical protein
MLDGLVHIRTAKVGVRVGWVKRNQRRAFPLWSETRSRPIVTGKVARSIAIFLTITVGLGLVVLSPLALRELNTFGNVDWSRLSEIGQTYGAASALLAMLALGGVAASLFFQARQAKTSNMQAVRGFQLELQRIALDDAPLYLPCWGPLDVPTVEGKQRFLYTNLIMNYLRMGYEIGAFTGSAFHGVLVDIFSGEEGRRYWALGRSAWFMQADSRLLRRFVRIVDDEYHRAVAAGPPRHGIDAVGSGSHMRPTQQGKEVGGLPADVLLGFASGAILGAVMRRPICRCLRPEK